MSLLSLPDVFGMFVLMGVLGWFRNRHRNDRVDVWLLGLTFILVEMIAASVIHGAGWWPKMTHAIALDAYLAAAVVFGWAARRELMPGAAYRESFVLSSTPLLVLTTGFGLGLTSVTFSLVISCVTLIAGLVYLLFLTHLRARVRSNMVAGHLAMWIPMLLLSARGSLRESVYWGLACAYLVVAVSFRRRAQPGTIGAWVIMVAFMIWSLCFMVYPLAAYRNSLAPIVEQVWNIQKFFVVIGMLLVLLEEETQRRSDEAMHDALTGLPNRRLFEDRLSLALDRSRRSLAVTAVFAIDLDGFKAINDTRGHQTGDQVLIRIAETLQRKVRTSDTIARCGGDEFLVIVNDLVKAENCARIAETLRAAIASVEVPGSKSLALSGSIGYAVFPVDGQDERTLCQVADMRMYEQKHGMPETRTSTIEGHIPTHKEQMARRARA